MYTVSPDHRTEFEPSPRWVRVYFNGQAIADSRAMMLMREANRLPLYYFPTADVRMDCLEPSERTTDPGPKGAARFWHVRVDGETAENAAFGFHDPPEGGPKLEDYVAFEWNKMERWFEEDEEIFVYARDPHKRIDVLPSSRHIKMVVDGTTVAETSRPWLLFETGLPTRYYMPKHDVRMDLLAPSGAVSRCPYKGEAELYTVTVGEKSHKDLAWTYRYPAPECARIQGMISLLNEKIDLYEDGKKLKRPKTPWS